VLVCSGQIVSVESALFFVFRDNIGNGRRVKMTEMRQAVGVINRRRNIKSFHKLANKLQKIAKDKK
jgi:hypothetical protein